MDMIREEFTTEPKLYDDQVVGIEYQVVWQDDNESEREVILGRFSQEEFATNAFKKYTNRLSKNNNLNLYPDSTSNLKIPLNLATSLYVVKKL